MYGKIYERIFPRLRDFASLTTLSKHHLVSMLVPDLISGHCKLESKAANVVWQ